MNSENNEIRPFLKWAGGKSWFVSNYSHLLPKKFNRYVEPFIGGGAVFFHLQPKKAIIGDSNEDLINTYRAIRDNWALVYKYLIKHHNKHNSDYYYKIRNSYPRSFEQQAARFIYLNRTCWNGLYRVNLKGDFNVPIGTKTNVIYDNDQFEQIAAILQKVHIVDKDFEYLINKSQKGDLLFVDPPYTVTHNNNSFIKYNEKLFSWDDQVRLYHALEKARKRGVCILATNANHNDIENIYKKTFKTIVVRRNSVLAGKTEYRKEIEELVILSR